MQLSIEISNYPLDQQYKAPIKDFIARLALNSQVTTSSNIMSTQVFGDYEVVMALLNQEMKASFERFGTMIFVVKFINADLTPNKP